MHIISKSHTEPKNKKLHYYKPPYLDSRYNYKLAHSVQILSTIGFFILACFASNRFALIIIV